MRLALAQAALAAGEREVPVGAVLLDPDGTRWTPITTVPAR